MKIQFSLISFSLLTALLFTGHISEAQDDEAYDKILFMIIDGDYEKAVSKAERYTNRDKTKRHPEPYILSSMAYYEMSKREEFQEDYPRAFRDAIKNAYKGRRYDKENEYFPKHERYITELKGEIMKEALYHYETENWRKAVTNAKYVNRIDPTDLSAILLKGICEIKGRNAYQAERTFEEADEIHESFDPEKLTAEEEPYFRTILMEFAELMKEEGEKSRGKEYLATGEELFAEDAEFKQFTANY